MESLYNPDLMTEQEIKNTFVAREALLDRLVETIKRQPVGAGVQHVLLIAPRGMGKTTMLLMVKFAVAEQELSPWLAIRFPEEVYNINDIADFWLEVLDGIVRETGDHDLDLKIARIKEHGGESKHLAEAAYSVVKGWCERNNRRIVLLVDNLNLILEVTDEQEDASLRQVLMNDGAVMLIGASPSFFRDASDHSLPLYNFFKTEHLNELSSLEIRSLLISRAVEDGVVDFEKTLEENATRLKVLEYFTGGSPRLVLMLYRVIAQSELKEVKRGLEKLLDEVTPYYKAKMESLPPQQRKIIDHIARVGSETFEGITPKDIATATRLTQSVVSSQLKRLAELGYVRAANIRGRNAYYALSERLFSLWYQMRFGRNARQKMGWLVNFLKAYYSQEELNEHNNRLGSQFQNFVTSGRDLDAKGTLEYRRWIVEAMTEAKLRSAALEDVIFGYLTLNDITTIIDDLLTPTVLNQLSGDAVAALRNAGCLNETISGRNDGAKLQIGSADPTDKNELARKLHADADALYEAADNGDFSNQAQYYKWAATSAMSWILDGEFEHALEVLPSSALPDDKKSLILLLRAISLTNLGRTEEAASIADTLVFDSEGTAELWYLRSEVYGAAGRYGDAVDDIRKAVQLSPSNHAYLSAYGFLLGGTGDPEEAARVFGQILDFAPDNRDALVGSAMANDDLGRSAEALDFAERGLVVDPDDQTLRLIKADNYASTGLSEEALVEYERILQRYCDNIDALLGKAEVQRDLERNEEAIETLKYAVQHRADEVRFWLLLGATELSVGRLSDSSTSLATAWGLLVDDEDRTIYGPQIQIMRLRLAVQLENFDVAELWNSTLSTGAESDHWHILAMQVLMTLMHTGHASTVRQLLSDERAATIFFPLRRAIEYVDAPSEDLIEKLTPEMRPIVTELIQRLSTSQSTTQRPNDQNTTDAKPKRRSGSRKRLK